MQTNVRIKTTLASACLVFSLVSVEAPGREEIAATRSTRWTRSREQEERPVAMSRKPSDEETRIRKRLDDWAAAFRGKDIDAVMAVFAPEVVSFDLVPPLAYAGRDAYRKQWERLFASYQGPIGYEIRELSITAEQDVAFSHSLNRISGTLKNGRKTGFWLRMTACWRKAGGQWLMVHEHVSVPVDLEKDKPVLDLAP